MSGRNNHYISITLDNELFNRLDSELTSTATIFIPYSVATNYTVHAMVRKFGRRLQVLEMNMGMEVNRLAVANRYIEQHGGELWTSLPSKQVSSQKKQSTSSKPGNGMGLWAKFSDEA
jgi:hypothetical protein